MKRGGGRVLETIALVALGASSVGLIAYWVGVTVPAVAWPELSGNTATLDGFDDLLAPSDVVRAASRPAADVATPAAPGTEPEATETVVTQPDTAPTNPSTTTPPEGPQYTPQGRVRTFLGCAESDSAEDLDRFFGRRIGPLLGWDNPHVTELGPDRWLWLAHDLYLDYTGDAVALKDDGPQIQNGAFLQVGSCFSIEHQGTPMKRLNFERGDDRIADENHLWPLGSEVHDDQLFVFWGETATARAEERPPEGNGITRHPVATWLATYDPETLERLSFEPAPNPGVDPVYGFAVASDDEHSYLFGNTNMLNFWRDGGLDNGPHSATRMYLARVPLGQLDQPPEYWDGSQWGPDPTAATPISARFWAENTMQPRFLDGQWISVVNKDGFFGEELWLEVAEQPWGPWRQAEVRKHRPRESTVDKNTYQPIILPWSSPSTGVAITISENAMVWPEAVANPSNYRPSVLSMDWPTDPIPDLHAASD